MNQPRLFDAPDPTYVLAEPWKARITDPITSHQADESMKGTALTDQQDLVLHHVGTLDRWGRDFTPWEAWEHMHGTFLGYHPSGKPILCPKENVLSKRLGELADLDMVQRLVKVTRPGSSHRHQQVFALTSEGRHYLEGRGS